MFALGILGVCQVLFFPGILIKRFINLPNNIFISLASIIGLSLISNFLIVFLFTSLGVFVQWLVIFMVVTEMATIIFLYRKELRHINLGFIINSIWNSISKTIQSLFPVYDNNEKNFIKVFQSGIMLISFVVAIIAIEWMSRSFRYNLGEVFNTWDAVVSWNRWAVDWASNQLPLRTQDYPQLIPANWALIYKLMGTTQIQFFAKAIMPLFPLLILLLLFGLGLETKNPAFFLSVELTRLIMKKFSAEFLAAGYVDFTLTFLVFLSFALLFLGYKEENLKAKLNYVFLSFIFVSGSVITKQPGFFALLSIFLLTVLFVLRNNIKTIIVHHKQQVVLLIILIGIIIIPWYLYKGIQILSGVEETHLLGALEHTNQVHDNRSLFANLIPGLKSLGNYFYIVLLLIPSLVFIEKFWRIISVFVVIPYIALWASYASYDPRNLTMMYPFIALLFCMGIFGLFFWIFRLMSKSQIEKIPVFSVFLLAGILIVATSFIWTKEKIASKQIDKQKLIFSVELNEKLYAFFSDREIEGKILTNYPVDYLPGFENTQKSIVFNEIEQFSIGINETDTHYLLYPTNVSDEIQMLLDDLESQSKLEIIFNTDSWIPYSFAVIKR